MIPGHFKVAKCQTVLGVSMLWLNFENMMEPSNCILKFPYLFVHASDVIKKLLTLSILY